MKITTIKDVENYGIDLLEQMLNGNKKINKKNSIQMLNTFKIVEK